MAGPKEPSYSGAVGVMTVRELVAAGLVETPGSPEGLRALAPLPARPDRPSLTEVLAELRDES